MVVFDKDPSTPSSAETDCYQAQLARVVPENLDILERFINNVWFSVDPSAGENIYSKAFEKAFEYFIKSPNFQSSREYNEYV